MSRKKNKTHKIAIAIGLVLSIFIITSTLYIAYVETMHEAKAELIKRSTKTSRKLQSFFNDVNTSLLQIIKNNNCTEKTQVALDTLVLNSPKLSIAYVRNAEMVCSSIRNLKLTQPFESQDLKLSLTGPITVDNLLNKAYQFKISNKKTEAGVIFPSSVISEILKLNSNNLITHSLFNETNKFYLFPEVDDKLSIVDMNENMTTINKLSVTKNIDLYSRISSKWIFNKLQPHLIYAALIALLICLFFVFIIRKVTIHKLSLASELKLALKNKQFIPYYQPVIDLASGKFSGVECLMRWKISAKDIMQPDLFIPCAERTQLIKPMTEQLIDQIFHELGPYAKENKSFHIAINLSPIHFRDRDIYHQIIAHCDYYLLTPNQIIFELTEQELIPENDFLALEIMNEMRQEGFSLAIDDFGTGHSSINYLNRFPFNFLKIDKQFVMAIGSNAITAQLADSMIDLAKNLNLNVIAEGIETHSQERHLKNRFITYGQGWLYSKALSYSELIKFIEKRTEHDK